MWLPVKYFSVSIKTSKNKTKLMIFYSFIQANLNYCPLIWINRNRTDMKWIENVQKRALRIVYNDRTSDYSELLNRTKICTIKTRWKRQLVTEVYKAMNNLTPSYISDMFKENTLSYNLRSSQIITQPKFNSQTHGYHSLRNEGTRLWATLPNSCNEAKDINTFKRMIVNYINWLLLMCFYCLLFILINVLFCGSIVLLFLVNCAFIYIQYYSILWMSV